MGLKIFLIRSSFTIRLMDLIKLWHSSIIPAVENRSSIISVLNTFITSLIASTLEIMF